MHPILVIEPENEEIMSATYRVTGTFDGAPQSFLVIADSPEHADQRVRDFFASDVGTVHKGIQLEGKA